MAALKVNPDNSVTLPIPLLALLLTAFLAVCGWGNSIRKDVADNTAATAKNTEILTQHLKEGATQYAELRAADADMRTSVNDFYARITAQNTAINETLTNVRITIAAQK